MATKKQTRGASGRATSARSTVSGPQKGGRPNPGDALAEKMVGTDALVASMPFNVNKAAEHGDGPPPEGATVPPGDPPVTGSTLTESMPSPKAGAGKPNLGQNPGNLPLDRVRTDATGRPLTTNQGVAVA